MHTGFGGKTEGKRSRGKPRHRWEDNIKADRKEILWQGMDWINVAQDRGKWQAVANMVMHFGLHKMWVIS
jgi:hypothetical protein